MGKTPHAHRKARTLARIFRAEGFAASFSDGAAESAARVAVMEGGRIVAILQLPRGLGGETWRAAIAPGDAGDRIRRILNRHLVSLGISYTMEILP